METKTKAPICGDTRDGYTCNQAPHSVRIDHSETRYTVTGFPFTAAWWNAGAGITGLDRVVVARAVAR